MREVRKLEFNLLASLADNVYRTKHHIVTQNIRVQEDDEEDTVICSYDTFYERTPERDEIYKTMFGGHINIDGRRLRADMSYRIYVK